MNKLSASGVSGVLHKYFNCYLKNRTQYTVINGAQSEKAHVEYDAPQGSLIGRTDFFSLNVNDMPEEVQEGGEVDLFADDSTAIVTGDSVDEAMLKMKNTAEKLDKYAAKNSLTIHPKKCKIIIISRKKFIGPLPQVSISGKHIEVVNKCKCLGNTIDQNLSWETHTSNICKSLSAKIKKLYNMRSMFKRP